jgi:hypothetical protein
MHPICMYRNLGIIALLISITGSVQAQKLLVLERPGTTKYYIFKVGDEIRLTDSRNMRKIHGGISRISDTSFVVNYLETEYPEKVTTVYRPLTMLGLFSRVAIDAGVGYFLLTGFNNAINKTSPLIDKGTLTASSVVTGSGLITRFFRYRKFKIGRSWRLKIIDLDETKH